MTCIILADLDDEKERACSYVHDLDLARELREETGERFDRYRAGRPMSEVSPAADTSTSGLRRVCSAVRGASGRRSGKS
jgi:hypothetical protein